MNQVDMWSNFKIMKKITVSGPFLVISVKTREQVLNDYMTLVHITIFLLYLCWRREGNGRTPANLVQLGYL